ncbi:hypothetical protein [Streptomyces sp. DSM 40750]|uniref:hypothetical protein n=1 Tax=Streptomyces sp. DSM 40750 TaxID=2801030 RepID=UPI00214C487A|nr:hypothetical protein [Streptomyces sp. DSM 40750]UUU24932.1 hypothetical protein JIX55_34390 [Streptomyces sp. DSM 40750]
MRKSIASALAVVALGGSLGLTATQASAAPATKVLPFTFNTNETQKVEDDAKFKTTAAGKVQFTITKKSWDHGIGIRLITCGKDWKSLTGWKEFKKKKGQYYTFDKSLKKNQCFKIQAGRSWAGNIDGKLKGKIKKA